MLNRTRRGMPDENTTASSARRRRFMEERPAETAHPQRFWLVGMDCPAHVVRDLDRGVPVDLASPHRGSEVLDEAHRVRVPVVSIVGAVILGHA